MPNAGWRDIPSLSRPFTPNSTPKPLMNRKRIEKLVRASLAFTKKLFQTILAVAKVVFLADKTIKFPPASKRPAVLMGNGPSLKETFEKYPSFFEGKEVFAVNHSPNSPYFFQVKPSTYVWFDATLWMYDPTKHTYAAFEETFKRLREVDWPMKFFAPTDARKSPHVQNLVKDNPNIQMVFMNNVVVNGFDWFRFWIYNLLWGNPSFRNVLHSCVFIALVQGYKEIYLVGVDHNFHQLLYVDEQNDLWIVHHHFYDTSVDTAYRSRIKSEMFDFQQDMSSALTSQGESFAWYKNMLPYMRKRKAQIFNSTERSFVDAYPRVKIADLLAKESLINSAK
jgi:hypothetical protein